jgi:hypothetical protein
MPRSRRYRTPKFEPELRDRGQAAVSLAGAARPADNIGRVAGALVSRASDGRHGSGTTITLCDGSQFTFSRMIDLPTSEDA